MENSPNQTAQVRPRIDELDALRGIAALSVVFFHFTMPWQTVNYNWLGIFSMGVDLFLIISGFVIFMTASKDTSWLQFAWNRFGRLYPAYWACVTITLLLMVLRFTVLVPAGHSGLSVDLFKQYIANMSMIQYYLGYPNLDGPYWTLIIELCFYFFIILMMLAKQLRHIMIIGFVLAVFCAGYSLPWAHENVWMKKILTGFPLIAYFPFFYGGMVLYQMKFEKVTFLRFAAFILTLIFQCLMFTQCYENRSFIKLYQYVPVLTFIYGVFLFFLFDKLRFIVNPVTMWLGRISYSLYLIHQYLGIRILIPQFIEKFGINFWLAAPIALIIVLVVAYCINRFIEVPAMRYLKSKFPENYKRVIQRLKV